MVDFGLLDPSSFRPVEYGFVAALDMLTALVYHIILEYVVLAVFVFEVAFVTLLSLLLGVCVTAFTAVAVAARMLHWSSICPHQRPPQTLRHQLSACHGLHHQRSVAPFQRRSNRVHVVRRDRAHLSPLPTIRPALQRRHERHHTSHIIIRSTQVQLSSFPLYLI